MGIGQKKFAILVPGRVLAWAFYGVNDFGPDAGAHEHRAKLGFGEDVACGDVFVFCSDGVFEAADARQEEFGSARLIAVVEQCKAGTARQIVDAIFAEVQRFRGDTPSNDDMTAVAIRITS